MHKFAKQIAECLKSKVEGKGIDNLNLSEVEELKAWSEIIKNIVCYDKDYRIIEAMDKEKKEEEESEKYFLKMLKEEYGMEDEEARRFYRGQPRSKTSGRFMRRGDGRRNYTPYSYMMPEMYDEDAEYYRDMDRSEGRMYYSGDSGSAPTPNSGNGNYSGGRRGYGKKRFNDGTSTRYEMAKRNYTEAKELHNGNSTEDKQAKMKELEKYMSELGSDITEMISDASNEEKTLLKSKLQVLAQKVV